MSDTNTPLPSAGMPADTPDPYADLSRLPLDVADAYRAATKRAAELILDAPIPGAVPNGAVVSVSNRDFALHDAICADLAAREKRA
jgi:hypothetical protein